MKKPIILILTLTFVAFCTAQNLRPMVKDVTFSLKEADTQVLLTWTLAEGLDSEISELLIYKNIGSIIKTSTLSILTPIATLQASETQFVDKIDDFNSYYYAVVARTNSGKIYDVIIPTVNATNIAVAKPKSQESYIVQSKQPENIFKNATPRIDTAITAPLRERPLPNIDILSHTEERSIPNITENTLHIVTSVDQVETFSENLVPYIFSKDKDGKNATGDDYTLYLIVSTDLVNENWDKAQQELLKFLQINRSQDTTARANFYLAQTYYFQYDYRSALTYFQKSEKLYPVFSKKWIEEALNRYTIG